MPFRVDFSVWRSVFFLVFFFYSPLFFSVFILKSYSSCWSSRFLMDWSAIWERGVLGDLAVSKTLQQHSWGTRSTRTLSFISLTLASSFCFSTTMVDDSPTPSCCKDTPLLRVRYSVHFSFIFCRYVTNVTYNTGLRALPRCSLLCPRSSVPPSGSWIWSWPCARDLPGSDPADTSTLTLQNTGAAA